MDHFESRLPLAYCRDLFLLFVFIDHNAKIAARLCGCGMLLTGNSNHASDIASV